MPSIFGTLCQSDAAERDERQDIQCAEARVNPAMLSQIDLFQRRRTGGMGCRTDVVWATDESHDHSMMVRVGTPIGDANSRRLPHRRDNRRDHFGPTSFAEVRNALYDLCHNPPMPDLILTRARVHTLDSDFTTAEAVAVENGRIVAVGANDDVLNLRGSETRVIDLNGAALLPGFNDAHCHILHFGMALGMVPLEFPAVKSIADVVQCLRERAAATAATAVTWLRGRGYDQHRLVERRHPDRNDLDGLPGDPYVLLTHASGHAVTVNSRVLQAARITQNTPDPPGGTIVRDADGRPTGVLLENAMSLASALAPTPTHSEKAAALRRAADDLNQMGITSASDASTSLDDITAYREAADGGVTLRCTLMLLIEQLFDGNRFRSRREIMEEANDEWVRIGPAKIFSDGALTTRTALLRSPYLDTTGQRGTAIWQTEKLNSLAAAAHTAGWQIAAHAIGDAAIDLCLEAFERAQVHAPRPDTRHRIEHAALLHGDQISRMARLGILPVFQPEFIARFGDAYLPAIGEGRAVRIKPYRDVLAAGLPLIFSSDLPVVSSDPLAGAAAAVQRRTAQGVLLGTEQAVDVRHALRAYTAGGAYSIFAEKDRGAISPGLRADFVVLDNDPLMMPVEEWADSLHVRATIVGGQIVYGTLLFSA